MLNGGQATAVPELREQLEPLTRMALIRRRAALLPGPVTDTTTAAKPTVRAIARRRLALDAEIKAHEQGNDHRLVQDQYIRSTVFPEGPYSPLPQSDQDREPPEKRGALRLPDSVRAVAGRTLASWTWWASGFRSARGRGRVQNLLPHPTGGSAASRHDKRERLATPGRLWVIRCHTLAGSTSRTES